MPYRHCTAISMLTYPINARGSRNFKSLCCGRHRLYRMALKQSHHTCKGANGQLLNDRDSNQGTDRYTCMWSTSTMVPGYLAVLLLEQVMNSLGQVTFYDTREPRLKSPSNGTPM